MCLSILTSIRSRLVGHLRCDVRWRNIQAVVFRSPLGLVHTRRNHIACRLAEVCSNKRYNKIILCFMRSCFIMLC